MRGERPLWDFPDGTLAGREVSAYLVGAATGWSPVPPTVLRDGPLGPGACQLWIDDDAGRRRGDPLLGFVPAVPRADGWHRDRVGARTTTAARTCWRTPTTRGWPGWPRSTWSSTTRDRKGGHILTTPDGAVYGVDHGVCFHVENKLRTILWGWIGERCRPRRVEVLRKLRVDLDGGLGEALSRAPDDHRGQPGRDAGSTGCSTAGTYPEPSGDWPAVPWPPI